MSNHRHPLLTEILTLVDSDWTDDFIYDIDSVKKTGVAILQWKKTKIPIPIKFELSSEAFEKTLLPRREIIAKIKEQLPSNLLKERIIRGNSILRLANRRPHHLVQIDLKKWVQDTAVILRNIYGSDTAKAFGDLPELPKDIKSGTLRALQAIFEDKFDFLKGL